MGTEDIKKLFLLVSVFALFTSGIVATVPVFADDDEEEETAGKKKSREIVVVGSKVKDVVRNVKLDECTFTFQVPGDPITITVNADKKGKVQIDIPEEKTSASVICTFVDGTQSEVTPIDISDKKKTKIKIQNAQDTVPDSFFDVFFDVELYSVDSFFDIFTELQNSAARADSFFDVFFDVYTVESFFDVFFDVEVATNQNTEDIGTIQTEIVALDLRGQSCPPNQFIVGVDTFGDIICQSVPPPVPVDNDFDNDGFDSAASGGDDCDDSDPNVNPEANEIPGNGVDDNCNGEIDESTGIDQDNDGFDSAASGGDDCDDDNPNVYPGAEEIPGNALDDNCNGDVDETSELLLGTYRFIPIRSDCSLAGIGIGSISVSEATLVSVDPFVFEIPVTSSLAPTFTFTITGELQYPAFGVGGSSSNGDASLRGGFTSFDSFDATVEMIDVGFAGITCDDVLRDISGTK